MSTYFFHSKRSRSHSRFFYLILCTVLVCPMLLFTGCGNITDADTSTTGNQPISISSIKLNTAVQITIYDSQDKALLNDCLALCDKYELIFSRTNEKSELYKLNHRKDVSDGDFGTDGPTTPYPVSGTADTWHISEDLAALLSEGLDITRESDGAFDIAIAPLTSLWDFTAEDPEVPDDAAIQKALPLCSSDGVTIDGEDITLLSDDIQFDVGAIAKGYIADRLKDFLIKKGVKSAIINLGGNVLCIGSKPDGTPFKIGIQKPFADRNETEAVMDITGKSVVSSGIYERCFKQDGKLYHHILNPQTGYPYDNGLISVTIISDQSVDGDALSTTCFALGLEDGLKFAEKKGVQAVFITEDYELHYTDGFRDEIRVTDVES
ncbi:FAD:protein FMN transferase [Blautia massiliensis]|jgi:thiamine biosynthesis lipoprotein|uniref:FAD:protein FMN transferase n=1 Tax=Blautia TaxID=572511 RepID=UPI001570BE83|nr:MULTISPECIES: FAD:protein FMN transferase [Blautia]MBN2956894.1 FAD:protein FMN transferase [Blautia massiliensis (ex Durand et al. 2017)]MCC2725196.1 FAD:protein FMN transferase [Blautia sp. MSK22_86]NSF55539.1 FAD:protein FMN transferase [Blautia massiliensis (ex Durand et al. 2017)]NSK71214.1 FAD:protein FMN transferase [Blautia massiliensis (ex Durand et al. 2017)]